ncbi:MAG: cytochrome b5 domain-containing protein, partial [Acidobacteriota bacterium]
MKKEELKEYDGKEGRPAYVAYKGNIYDVTNSKLWKNGSHINRHFAGEDLTDQMSVAPHGDDIMSRFEIVGTFEAEEITEEHDKMDRLRDWYRKFHPHPVFIHFPMGLFFFSAIMQLLFLIFNYSPYENAAFYSLLIAAVTSIPATLSGIFSWWLNYQTMLTRTFKMKLYLSIILVLLGILAALIRIFIPTVSFDSNLFFYVYNCFLFASFPM